MSSSSKTLCGLSSSSLYIIVEKTTASYLHTKCFAFISNRGSKSILTYLWFVYVLCFCANVSASPTSVTKSLPQLQSFLCPHSVHIFSNFIIRKERPEKYTFSYVNKDERQSNPIKFLKQTHFPWSFTLYSSEKNQNYYHNFESSNINLEEDIKDDKKNDISMTEREIQMQKPIIIKDMADTEMTAFKNKVSTEGGNISSTEDIMNVEIGGKVFSLPKEGDDRSIIEGEERKSKYEKESLFQLYLSDEKIRKFVNSTIVSLCFAYIIIELLTVDSGIWRGWTLSEILIRLPYDNWQEYEGGLSEFPILTKTIINVVIYLIGDWMSQIEWGRKEGLSSIFEFDISRTLKNGLIGLIFGQLVHYYYDFSDIILPLTIPQNRIFKIIMDQTIYFISKCALYISLVGLLRGDSIDNIKNEISTKLKPIVFRGWKFWPLAHLITYFVIPPRHRVLWVNCLDLVWSSILANFASGKTKKENLKERDGIQQSRNEENFRTSKKLTLYRDKERKLNQTGTEGQQNGTED